MTTRIEPQAPMRVGEGVTSGVTTGVSSGWYGAASSQVARFLHRLRTIPASAWRAAAEAEAAHGVHSAYAAPDESAKLNDVIEEQVDYAARRRLHEALEPMPAVVRRIRDRIDTDLAIFHGIIPEPAVQRMRRAAHLAAFALAAHPFLDPADVERLYRPFRDLIPPPPELRLG